MDVSVCPMIWRSKNPASSNRAISSGVIFSPPIAHTFKDEKAARQVLEEWTARLRAEVGDGFPEKVTAFHPKMAVHGKYGASCPVCGTTVQRIVYASRETNYCPGCQTGGKILADRSLSRLLKDDWPKTVDDLDE